MIITEDIIRRAEDIGACTTALRWLREQPRTSPRRPQGGCTRSRWRPSPPATARLTFAAPT